MNPCSNPDRYAFCILALGTPAKNCGPGANTGLSTLMTHEYWGGESEATGEEFCAFGPGELTVYAINWWSTRQRMSCPKALPPSYSGGRVHRHRGYRSVRCEQRFT